MNVKMFNKIVKDEKLKNDHQILIKVSYVDKDGNHKFKVVESEGYNISAEGVTIGCFFGNL